MYIFYNDKTDYLEVLEKKVRNYSEVMENGIFKIKSEKNHKTIGYGIENISMRLKDLDLFSPFVRLSILVKISRLKHHYTQKQVADKMKIGLLPYQRLESGTNNPTLKTLLRLKQVLPEVDLSLIASSL